MKVSYMYKTNITLQKKTHGCLCFISWHQQAFQ